MRKKLFKSIVLVTMSVLFLSIILIFFFQYKYLIKVQQEKMRTYANIVGNGIEVSKNNYLKTLSDKGYRITWIDKGGYVLFDNMKDYKTLENHSNRIEVKNAIKRGFGESSRYSKTMTKKSLYVAKRLNDNTIIRIGDTQKGPFVLLLYMVDPIIFIIIISIILSILLSGYVTKKIIKPLNDIDLDRPLSNKTYDEIAPLLLKISKQHTEIDEKKKNLIKQKEEFKVITRGMSEGLILLDKDNNILSINKAALNIFGEDKSIIGTNFLNLDRSLKFQKILNDTKKENFIEKEIEKNNRVYNVRSTYVNSEGLYGIVLLLFDITEKKRADDLRREFTANVSHELKTPLHMISGSAELLLNGLVKEEDKKEFVTNIYNEAKHLSTLVSDIINLSMLDERKYNLKFNDVDIYELSKSVISRLSNKAKESNVLVNLIGEKIIIKGIDKLIENIIYNLLDNAIKYNKKGGKVTVSLENTMDGVCYSVIDTGIGIPSGETDRIFERFYRVDKSRSKEKNGTGLGLSIVKHALSIHNASIDIESTLGKGTKISILFPKDIKVSL